MINPIQITFRNMQSSAAVAARINTEAARLDRYYPRITSCRVFVEAPHRHRRRGEHFHVRIELSLPGTDVIVRHEPRMRAALTQSDGAKWSKHFEVQVPHKDIYVTIRDAFNSARRQLEDHARRLRGDVKMHDRTPPLRLAKITSSEQRRSA